MRKTIYMADSMEIIIGQTDNLSTRVTSMLTYFNRVCQAECPELPLDDWLYLSDILGWVNDIKVIYAVDPAMLWAVVANSGNGELSDRLRGMRLVEIISIIEIIILTWTTGEEVGDMGREWFERHGARVI